MVATAFERPWDVPNDDDGREGRAPDPTGAGPTPDDGRAGPAPVLGMTPVIVTLSDIAPRAIDWLWRGWLPRGKVTILGGHPGDGKSTLALALAATLSRGGPLPDGQRAPQTSTLLLLAEDDLADTVRPRIDVHGGDPARIHALEAIRDHSGRDRFVSLAEHAPLLGALVAAHGIGLVVIDPLTAFLPRADRNAEGDVRDALMPLVRLAQETGVAVLGIMHVGKAGPGAGRKPLQALLGSTAFGAIARVVLMTADLPAERQPPAGADGTRTTHKLLGVVKSNVAQRPAAWAWCRPADGPIQWLGPSAESIETVLTEPLDNDRKTRPIDEAIAFLREYLADRPRFARDVEHVATQRGITKKTLERAKEALDIRPFKAAGVRNGSFIWPSLTGTREMLGDVDSEDPHTPINGEVTIFPE